ncbi:TfoX/Sxy family protein [Euzebya sp.]|uniref:TfoX/Sxy family protein n=1 Tax=Euzebya sp. TaxID=1971409 RepID=UPI003512F013
MAYDEELATRIRERLAGEPDVTEQRMFGGLAFLLGGHMAVAAINAGGMMVRVGQDAADALVDDDGQATVVEMRGRPMRGWLEVAAGQVQTDAQLAAWVDRGVALVRSLPPKA